MTFVGKGREEDNGSVHRLVNDYKFMEARLSTLILDRVN